MGREEGGDELSDDPRSMDMRVSVREKRGSRNVSRGDGPDDEDDRIDWMRERRIASGVS